MWPKKSRRVINASATKTRNKPARRSNVGPCKAVVCTGSLLFVWAFFAGCGRDAGEGTLQPSPFTLQAAHLHDYAWRDRNRNGQPDNLKPEDEREALLQAILPEAPDVLVLRGLGSESALLHFQEALQAAGHEMSHAHYIPGPTVYAGIGILSSVKPLETQSLSEVRFTVRGRSHQPLAGGLRISARDDLDLWIWNADLSDPSVAYERRRNEARLLSQTLRPLVQEGQHVLLSLHSREDPDSPMLRMIRDIGLQRVTPVDDHGDSWTHRDPDGFTYRMDQWIFATEALHAQIETARVIDSPEIRAAGPFRHQVLTLGVPEPDGGSDVKTGRSPSKEPSGD
ncbi:MAG: endonuclease/exonuclease/phosphatase family protein [Verrucomicrobia bacterium]|nr:endonuclease/exonuclease/phosphatase family protein [Verrucomicrobiota bacterium]MCH8511314.1 hypothetical protein [Kiritimatiellia bacterium]